MVFSLSSRSSNHLFVSVYMASPCVEIAYGAARGIEYILGDQRDAPSCPSFQDEFKSVCCADTETFDDRDVCEVCVAGVAPGKK
jgi:hypothetical protein